MKRLEGLITRRTKQQLGHHTDFGEPRPPPSGGGPGSQMEEAGRVWEDVRKSNEVRS